MGIKDIIHNRLLASAKPFEQHGRWRPGEKPLRLVGLVLCLEDISEMVSLKKVQAFFTEQGAVCLTCIFKKDKKMEISKDLFDEDTVLLNQDSINWYGAVQTGCVAFFLQKSFDLVINLSKDFFFPVSYLASLTAATIKIGRYLHPYSPYRLVLGANDHGDADAFIHLLNSSLQFIKFE